jgi:hypothetical protein
MLYTGNAPWPLVIVFALMGGVPGFAQLLVQLRGATERSGSPASPPSSSSPTSSSTPGV